MAIPEADLAMTRSKKLTVSICGILMGGFAIHKFVLGYAGTALLQILLSALIFGSTLLIGSSLGYASSGLTTLASCLAGLTGLVEGGIYLFTPDEHFYKTYIRGQKHWF